jgi:hypothetical protein
MKEGILKVASAGLAGINQSREKMIREIIYKRKVNKSNNPAQKNRAAKMTKSIESPLFYTESPL